MELAAPIPSTQWTLDANKVAHRFRRGDDQIGVMIADHPAPKMVTTLGGRFGSTAGTR
jgi:hypothetical protein